MAGKFPRSKLLQDDANLGRGHCGCADVALRERSGLSRHFVCTIVVQANRYSDIVVLIPLGRYLGLSIHIVHFVVVSLVRSC